MEAVWLLVGLVVGGLVGATLMLRLERTRRDGQEGAEVARLRAQLEAAHSLSDTLTSAREEFVAVVRQGAGEELAQRGEQLVALVTTQLEATVAKAGADDAERKRAVEKLVAPVGESLAKLTVRLNEVDASRQRTETELTAQLRTVTTGQQDVARNAAALERALRQPHVRGRWGELGLRRLVEAAGMSGLCDFDEQTHINDDGQLHRPDMVVNLPVDRHVVVDAKVPLSPFLDAMEASDEAERVEKLKLFARAMRGHVRRLADKSYAAQFASAPDFVVMYLPGDHFLSGALEVDPDLLEDAFAKRVHIATPATLLALLRTVAYAFQQEKIATDAQAIGQLGRELYDRIAKLLVHIDKVSRCVNSLVAAQDAVVGSVEGRVLPTARKFAALGVTATDEELPELQRVPAVTRRVQAAELTSPDVRELPPSPREEAA